MANYKSSYTGAEIDAGIAKANTALQEHQDISGKVDKVEGKGLSTNDYTTAEKEKLAGIDMSEKQDTLVSGKNIKTINNQSLLGSGNITIQGGGGSDLPIVNVIDFGATGDGSTDDTQAIQDALDSVSTGGTIFFPKGVYMLSTCLFNASISGTSHAIEVYSNQRLYFEEGATLKRGAAAVNHMLFTHNESGATGYTGAENIEIIGATIDGNRTTYSSSQTPFNLSHSKNVKIIDCIFKNIGSGWHAIEINSSLDTVVDGCLFENNTNTEDIQLDTAVGAGNLGSSDGTVCKDTIIKNCVFDMTSGVAIGNHTNAAHTNTRIYNNVFKGTPNSSRGYLNFVANHQKIDVYDNTFYGGAYGVVIPHTTKDSTVFNNRFDGTTTPYSGTGITKWTNFINNVLESGDVAPQSNLAFIENNLTSVQNSSDVWIVKSGTAYTGTLTPTDPNYTMGTVTIAMGGTDITSTAYDSSTGVVSIASVTADVTITAFAYDDSYVQVTNTLTNVSNSNTDTMTEKNESYTGTLTASAGYVIDTVSVMMGSTDITSTAYDSSAGVISIASVTDNLVITATAVEDLTLPAGYTRLKALQTSGTQYTMTDYVVKTTTDIYISDFATRADSSVNYQTFLGSATADNASNSFEFRCYQKSTKLNFNRGNSYDLFAKGPTVTSANLIRLHDTILTVDGTDYDVKTYFPSAKANNGSLPIQLFGRNLNGSHERISTFAQLGLIKIYEGDTLVKRYIPCLDDNNEPCFYDNVNDDKLTNLGTGTFGTVALENN